MHRDTIYISFFWGAPEFLGAYHILFSLFLFKLFYVDSLLLVQVKHKRTLYKFFFFLSK